MWAKISIEGGETIKERTRAGENCGLTLNQNTETRDEQDSEKGEAFWYINHQWTLTLTLLDVGVELVQSSHGDLSDLWVEQDLHQGGGDVFTGRHAGRLSYLTLREKERETLILHVGHSVRPRVW